MLDSRGSEKYSIDLDIPSGSSSWENCLLQYKQLDTEDVIVFTGGTNP